MVLIVALLAEMVVEVIQVLTLELLLLTLEAVEVMDTKQVVAQPLMVVVMEVITVAWITDMRVKLVQQIEVVVVEVTGTPVDRVVSLVVLVS